jgi:hypothetical protein
MPRSAARLEGVLVRLEMDFCLIGFNGKWLIVTNLF